MSDEKGFCDLHSVSQTEYIIELRKERDTLKQQLAQAQAACAQLSVRITDYLSCGGLFNPEAMEHDKVRDLLIDCRDNFNGRKQEGWLSPDESKRLENCIAICEAKNEELCSQISAQLLKLDELTRDVQILRRWQSAVPTQKWQEYRAELFRILAEHNFTALESEMEELEHLIMGYHAGDIECYYREREYLERILSQAGEHSLPESAENRMRELEEYRAKVFEQRDALEAHHKWHQEQEESDAYADSSLAEKTVDALKIHTSDSALSKHLHYLLGLLRGARSHIPESAIAGSTAIRLDREIERLEKLIPRETTETQTAT